MRRALKLARSAGECGEVPVGAVVVDSANNVLGAAANTRHATGDYAGHAEIIALNQAAKTLQNRVLEGCKLFITLEPCVMCAGAILASRVPQVIFAAWDHKAGAAGSVYDLLREGLLPYPVPEVIGGSVYRAESERLLHEFFALRRDHPQRSR